MAKVADAPSHIDDDTSIHRADESHRLPPIDETAASTSTPDRHGRQSYTTRLSEHESVSRDDEPAISASTMVDMLWMERSDAGTPAPEIASPNDQSEGGPEPDASRTVPHNKPAIVLVPDGTFDLDAVRGEPLSHPDTDDDDADGEDSNMDSDRIRLGVCAMDKKARSKPMAEILSRLDEDLFKVVFFGDEVILNQPIEDWPICDVLIAFFSKGYPLHKAKAYVALRKPLILNDLDTQEILQDRRKVYDLLEASGIDVPRHVYLSRDGYVSTGTGDGNRAGDPEVQEFDDHIEYNGVCIHKPFVEKPVNAEGMELSLWTAVVPYDN